MTKRVLKNILKNGNEYEVGNIKLYVITEDIVSVSTDATKGVSPYNTSCGYTNITIDESSGIKWKVGAAYIFVINTEMVVASAYRNIRVRIGNGNYIPVMNQANTILAGSSYFTKARNDFYIYKTTQQSGGALHLSDGQNNTYSAMSVAEGKTGTATSGKLLTAANLKQIIGYHAGNLHDDTKQDALTAGEGITIDENNVISSNGGGAIMDFINGNALATNTKSLTSSGTESIILNNSTSLIVINGYIDGFSGMNNFGQGIFMMLTKNNTIGYIRLGNGNEITLTANFTNHSLSIAKTITGNVGNGSITIKEF